MRQQGWRAAIPKTLGRPSAIEQHSFSQPPDGTTSLLAMRADIRDGFVGMAGRIDRIAAVQEERGQRPEKAEALLFGTEEASLAVARRLEGIEERVRAFEEQQQSLTPSAVSSTSSTSRQYSWFQETAVLRHGGPRRLRPVLQTVGAGRHA